MGGAGGKVRREKDEDDDEPTDTDKKATLFKDNPLLRSQGTLFDEDEEEVCRSDAPREITCAF